MDKSEIAHKILSLLKSGPYMTSEIQCYCRQVAPDEVTVALFDMESSGRIKYNVTTGLYKLSDGEMA